MGGWVGGSGFESVGGVCAWVGERYDGWVEGLRWSGSAGVCSEALHVSEWDRGGRESGSEGAVGVLRGRA